MHVHPFAGDRVGHVGFDNRAAVQPVYVQKRRTSELCHRYYHRLFLFCFGHYRFDRQLSQGKLLLKRFV